MFKNHYSYTLVHQENKNILIKTQRNPSIYIRIMNYRIYSLEALGYSSCIDIRYFDYLGNINEASILQWQEHTICSHSDLGLVFLGHLPNVKSWTIYLTFPSLGSLICKMGIIVLSS